MNFKKKVKTTKRMKDWMNYLTEGRKRKLELSRIIWKGVVVPVIVFGLAATGGNVKEMKEIEILQRKAWRGALEL